MSGLEKHKRELVEGFPWEEEGETRPQDPKEQEQVALAWLTRRIKDLYDVPTGQLFGLIERVTQKQFPLKDRFYAVLDRKAPLLKTAESTLEKMARKRMKQAEQAEQRKQAEQAKQEEPIDFRNFHHFLKDLGRFRTVTNFLRDMQELKKAIEGAVNTSPEAEGEQGNFARNWGLENNEFTDLVLVLPDKRKVGERCYKGTFQNREDEEIFVEVQIVTMLQDAWDKKDHFLLYEPRRQGKTLSKEWEIESYAISETLYMVDLAFERLYRDTESQRTLSQETESTASSTPPSSEEAQEALQTEGSE